MTSSMVTKSSPHTAFPQPAAHHGLGRMRPLMRVIKHVTQFCLCLWLLAGIAQAAPFAKQFEFQQPNGLTINLWGQGDDFRSVFETLDGYTVVFDPPTKTYFYATVSPDGATLVPADLAVGNGNPQSLALPKHLRISPNASKQQAAANFQRWEQGMQTDRSWKALKATRHALDEAAKNNPQSAPPASTTTGNKIGLCLLIDFPDAPSSISQSNVDNFCNGDAYTGYDNNGSVKKYFSDNSNGKLTYTNVVTTYIRMAQPKSYYNDVSIDCGTQGNLLIQDAIAIMKALPNYTTTILPLFDNLTVNGGNVVACNVFFAGSDSGAWAQGLWPHSSSLYHVGAKELSPNGKKIFKYQITNIGNALTLGTFCHENGHMLCGFPDIYDYDSDSVGGAGNFCLMDYGNFGGDGKNPSQICAYLKHVAGWATVTDITRSSSLTAMVTATPGTPGFNNFYRFAKPGVSTEYFLIENRQKSGRDASLPASGIAIWHVDELGDHYNQSLVPNSSHANYEVTLEQADNLWHFQNNVNGGDAQDLFYAGNSSAAYTNRFSDSSTPNAHWWNGANSGIVLTSFSASASSMTFTVGNPDVNDINSFDAVVADDSHINLSWIKNAANSNVMVAWNTTDTFGTPTGSYSAGGSIAGGGTVLYNGSASSTLHGGLVVGTTYYYKAWSVLPGPAYSTGVTASTVAGVVTEILSEGFENRGNIPIGWTQEKVSNPIMPWTFQDGGASGYGYPSNAHSGKYNAGLYATQTTDHITRLVTPALTFGTNTINTQVRFWHCMPSWIPNQDELRVWYRTSPTGQWMLLKTYTADTSAWVQRTINLPSPGATCYIAFEANAKYGLGVYIDDVQVVGMTPSDVTPPSVTINQGTLQADPTHTSPIDFTVEFNEPVTDFTADGVTISGTAPGTKVATVTGSGSSYHVAVTGMTGTGTVIASVVSGTAHDAAGNANTASTSTDHTVLYDISPPTVTVNQALTQSDPTNASTINFTVVFNKPVADFTSTDVTLTGNHPNNLTALVTGSGTTYNIAVTGMTGGDSVTALIAPGVAHDAFSYPNLASTSTDNTVTYDDAPPTVTINQAADQPDPTNSLPVNFTVIFSKGVTDFDAGDVTIAGTSNGQFCDVTGGGTTYNVAVGGMRNNGTVIVSLAAGVAHDLAGNANIASTTTDNVVILDGSPPSVTINQAATQADPTNSSTLYFSVVFNKSVTGFTADDVVISGDAPGVLTTVVTGSGMTYSVAVTGMSGTGTVIADIASGAAQDAATNLSEASTSTDNAILYDISSPTVTINQAATQSDPAYTTPINFSVVFSEPVADFATGDVTITGTAPGTITATVTGSGSTYNVAVNGITGAGSVIANIMGAVAHDALGNANTPSTSIDNSINYVAAPTVTINQAATQADPTKASPINFTVVFSRPVTGFTSSDITLTSTASGTKTVVVTGTGATYNVAVSGMTGTGTVIATIDANKAQDATTGNANIASTSTDNLVTYDITAPTVTLNQASTQPDPTTSNSINFTAVFSEPVTGFEPADVTLSGTAPGTKTVTLTTLSATTYNVAVSGMTSNGTVIVAIAASKVQDLAGNANTAASSTDKTVTYKDATAPTATINQAAAQADPTNSATINYTVTFSESVTGFATGEVIITGTTTFGTKKATVTGAGTTYNVAVTGMTGNGPSTVIATIAAGVAQDAAGNVNVASTSSDNSVTYDKTGPKVTIIQSSSQSDPTNNSTINYSVVFTKAVADFAAADVAIAGTAPGPKVVTVTGSGMVYHVAVSGMTGSGTVIATIAAGVAHDAFNYANFASTTTDNTVTYAPPGMQSWRLQYFGTIGSDGDADDLADPNHNGVPNLMEYALGDDPMGTTTSPAMLPKAIITPGGRLELSLTRLLDRTDITLTVQGSDSLTGSWPDLASSINGAPFSPLISGVIVTESGTGTTRAVKVEDLYPTSDPAHPRRFMRLRVTHP